LPKVNKIATSAEHRLFSGLSRLCLADHTSCYLPSDFCRLYFMHDNLESSLTFLLQFTVLLIWYFRSAFWWNSGFEGKFFLGAMGDVMKFGYGNSVSRDKKFNYFLYFNDFSTNHITLTCNQGLLLVLFQNVWRHSGKVPYFWLVKNHCLPFDVCYVTFTLMVVSNTCMRVLRDQSNVGISVGSGCYARPIKVLRNRNLNISASVRLLAVVLPSANYDFRSRIWDGKCTIGGSESFWVHENDSLSSKCRWKKTHRTNIVILYNFGYAVFFFRVYNFKENWCYVSWVLCK